MTDPQPADRAPHWLTVQRDRILDDHRESDRNRHICACGQPMPCPRLPAEIEVVTDAWRRSR